MKIYTTYFDKNYCNRYFIMSVVLEYSIKKNMPNAELIKIKSILPKERIDIPFKQIAVHEKLKIYNEIIQKQNEDILLIDSDTVILSDVSDVFNDSFDIAYTTRDISTHPMNSGVIFIHPSQLVRDFFNDWIMKDELFLNDKEMLISAQEKCSGYNQASFMEIKEKDYGLQFKELPCQIYNLCWGLWQDINEKTKILHVNGKMQKAIFDRDFQVPEFMQKAYNKWYEYYNEFGMVL